MQDIEAEDHILGPLTLRQFLFALAAAFLGYMCFLSIDKHILFMLAVFVPPFVFCAFFAFPFGMDQPTEVWALAKIRYLFKPRVRTWNQSGVKELVTITAPKKVEPIIPTKGLSQTEVKSRLKALADTIDTRGWAVKNVNPFMPQAFGGDSDRLINLDSLPQAVPEIDEPADNMEGSPLSSQFDTMMSRAAQSHRQELIDQLSDNGPPAVAAQPSNWFVQPAATGAPSAGDAALSQQLKARTAGQPTPYSHLRTLQPLGSQPPMPPNPPVTAAPVSAGAMTTPKDPDILALANNNDLNVTTLAHEARRSKAKKEPPDEVVIPLR
jgi:hypothetical protein